MLTYVEKWKGKDVVTIEQVSDGWFYIDHRKDKLSGDVVQNRHFVSLGSVNYMCILLMYEYILTGKKEFKKGYFFKKIIQDLKLGLNTDEFYGGKNRSKYYFPLYYYPIKVIESYNYITYKGSGGIILNESFTKAYSKNNMEGGKV